MAEIDRRTIACLAVLIALFLTAPAQAHRLSLGLASASAEVMIDESVCCWAPRTDRCWRNNAHKVSCFVFWERGSDYSDETLECGGVITVRFPKPRSFRTTERRISQHCY